MNWRIPSVLVTLFLALIILFASIFQSASVRYAFSQSPSPTPSPGILEESQVEINYQLAFPGKVLPDSSLWPLKALRDKVWLSLTVNKTKKAELRLLFADKRVWAAKMLFEKKKYDLGYSTLSKAEKYLEEAGQNTQENKNNGYDTKELLVRLANASLKHWQTIDEILIMAPEDARPEIIKLKDYSMNTFKKARDSLHDIGQEPPDNPFDGIN